MLSEVNNLNSLGNFKQAHRTFSRETENRAPLSSTTNLTEGKSQYNANDMYYKRNEGANKRSNDTLRSKVGLLMQNENNL